MEGKRVLTGSAPPVLLFEINYAERRFTGPYLSVVCHNNQLHVLGHFKGLSFVLPKESESLVCLNTSPGLPAHRSCLSDNKNKSRQDNNNIWRRESSSRGLCGCVPSFRNWLPAPGNSLGSHNWGDPVSSFMWEILKKEFNILAESLIVGSKEVKVIFKQNDHLNNFKEHSRTGASQRSVVADSTWMWRSLKTHTRESSLSLFLVLLWPRYICATILGERWRRHFVEKSAISLGKCWVLSGERMLVVNHLNIEFEAVEACAEEQRGKGEVGESRQNAKVFVAERERRSSVLKTDVWGLGLARVERLRRIWKLSGCRRGTLGGRDTHIQTRWPLRQVTF